MIKSVLKKIAEIWSPMVVVGGDSYQTFYRRTKMLFLIRVSPVLLPLFFLEPLFFVFLFSVHMAFVLLFTTSFFEAEMRDGEMYVAYQWFLIRRNTYVISNEEIEKVYRWLPISFATRIRLRDGSVIRIIANLPNWFQLSPPLFEAFYDEHWKRKVNASMSLKTK